MNSRCSFRLTNGPQWSDAPLDVVNDRVIERPRPRHEAHVRPKRGARSRDLRVKRVSFSSRVSASNSLDQSTQRHSTSLQS